MTIKDKFNNIMNKKVSKKKFLIGLGATVASLSLIPKAEAATWFRDEGGNLYPINQTGGSGVPYTGATDDVDLGQHTLTTIELIKNGNFALTYNGSNQLTRKVTTNGTTTDFTYNPDGTLATKTNTLNTWTYSYSNGLLTGVAIT